MATRCRLHPEHKTLDHTGRPCSKTSRGLLKRRPVTVADIVIIGKEANKLTERETGNLSIEDRGSYQNVYDDGYHWRTIIIPRLREVGAKTIAEAVGVSERRSRDWINEIAKPHPRHKKDIATWLHSHDAPED